MPKISINELFCKGCGICIEFCPKDILQKGDKLSPRGIAVPKIVNLEKCIVCQNCELYCPEFAVSVEE